MVVPRKIQQREGFASHRQTLMFSDSSRLKKLDDFAQVYLFNPNLNSKFVNNINPKPTLTVTLTLTLNLTLSLSPSLTLTLTIDLTATLPECNH